MSNKFIAFDVETPNARNNRISAIGITIYACTCAMGRKCYPDLDNYRLSTLCSHLGIELDHHHAGSDSRACAELLIDYMDHGLPVDKYLRRYDLSNVRAWRNIW